MTDYGPMRKALAFALERAPEGTLTDADAVVKALAKRYCDLIDDAAVTKPHADALNRIHSALVGTADPKTHERAIDDLRTIMYALAAHTVAADFGPKLLAALAQLRLTPAARGAVGGGPGRVVSSTLEGLQAKYAPRPN